MAHEPENTERSNGVVLMSAALIAGAASGVASLLNEARHARSSARKANAADEVRDEIQQSATQVRASAENITEIAKARAPKLKKDVQKKASNRIADVSDRAAKAGDQIRQSLGEHGVDVDAGVEKAKAAAQRLDQTLEETQERGRAQAKKGRKQVESVRKDFDAFSQAGRELGQRLHERLPEAGGNLQEKVVPRLAEMRQQAEHSVSGVIDTQRKNVPEIATNVQRSVAPVLKDLGKQASETAAQVAATGRERAPEWKAYLEEHVLPHVDDVRQRAALVASDALETGGERAGQARERLVPELKQSAEELSKRFAESLDQAEQSFSDFRGNASQAVEAAETRARVVGTNARTGGMNAGATVLWTGVAAGVVYAGLLNAGQRRWVKSKAQQAFSGARSLYADVRGHDGEFSTGDEPTA